MPVLVESSLPFEKVTEREYVYTSDTLPEGNLQISIDENGWQNFISTLKSPYFQIDHSVLCAYHHPCGGCCDTHSCVAEKTEI